MYLRGNRWSMTKRRRKNNSFWRIALLVVLIGIGLYVNQVVVPATPPLFIPTPTPTTSPEAFLNQAQEYFKAGKIPQAIDAYKQAIDADPSNPSSYVELARIQIFNAQYEDAVTNAQNALLKNPNNPLAHAVQGWALGFLGKYGEAELELNNALTLDPKNALAHAYLAETLINEQNPDVVQKAIDESKLAINYDSNILETHRARGIVLLNTGNVGEAINEFQAALAINKNIADVHLYLGVAFRANQEYDKAEESLLAAVAYNPNDPTALTEISRTYFADGKYRQAAQYAENAVNIDPTNPRLHGDLGIMYYKIEEYSKAIPELTLAVSGGTTADGKKVDGLPLDYDLRVMSYYWYYGFALAKNNQCNQAVPVANALLQGVPNDETAVYNANAIIGLCQNGGATSTPESSSQAEATATPAQ
jgi:tetratricopeptide (TPR) repeat protein